MSRPRQKYKYQLPKLPNITDDELAFKPISRQDVHSMSYDMLSVLFQQVRAEILNQDVEIVENDAESVNENNRAAKLRTLSIILDLLDKSHKAVLEEATQSTSLKIKKVSN